VGEEAKSGESRIRRNTVTSDALLIRPVEGIDTVYDVLVYAARESGSKDTMGTREILKVHEEYKDVEKTVGGKVVVEKKKWQYYELSGFKYITYAEMKKRADAIGRGLTDLGLKKGDNLNVYSSTR
jgi:long-chain acyl-CoA synthetase